MYQSLSRLALWIERIAVKVEIAGSSLTTYSIFKKKIFSFFIINHAYDLHDFYKICVYEGRPICSDNGLISQKLLLKSEVYYPLHVVMGVTYSCVKCEVFITTGSYAIQICKQHCESPWPQKITFLTN